MDNLDNTKNSMILNTPNGTLDLNTPKVMGIVNVTPDSFYAGSRYLGHDNLIGIVEKMIGDGAALVDIGAVSTRPGSKGISREEELERLIPFVKETRKAFPELILSVDTYRSEVAEKAVDAGAGIINDISGGTMDEKMISTVARLNVPYILMHMQGTPENMQVDPTYENVVQEVKSFFLGQLGKFKDERMNAAIILDPGFGFGKTVDHNFELLAGLKQFHQLGHPVMAGISRKSIVNRILRTKPEGALNGTTVLNTIALMNGANILRVHDVKEATQAILLTEHYKKFINT
mgnify:FL=1